MTINLTKSDFDIIPMADKIVLPIDGSVINLNSIPNSAIQDNAVEGQKLTDDFIVPSEKNLQSGNFVLNTTGWQFTGAGILNAVGVNLSGSIIATSGYIGGAGGWVITTDYIYSLVSGTPTSNPSDGIVLASGNEALIVYENTEKRVEVGYLSSGVYGIKAYADDGTTPIFEVSDTQKMIGGWIFSDTTLATNATIANANVLIDSANSLIRLGATTGNYITLDGANLRLRSSNYSTGVSGFTIEPTLIEAENLVARGILKGSTFQYDVISSIGGQFLVANSDVLASDMTALDASTLTTKGTTTWAVNDIIVLRGITALGIQEEWMRITAIGSAPTYTVTRDLAGSFTSNVNPIWQAGTTIVKQGSSDGSSVYSGGWLKLLGEGTNAPYYSVLSRTGVAYNAYTEKIRLGNLNGFLDFTSDAYGIGIGNANNYLTYDDVSNLLKLKGVLSLLGTLQLKSYTVATLPVANPDTGLKSPTANEAWQGNPQWTNPANAYADDANYATATDDSNERYQVYTAFSLNIPDGAVITGIEVTTKGKTIDNGGGGSHNVTVGVLDNTGTYRNKTQAWTTTESVRTSGGVGDIWSGTWNYINFSDGNCKLRINTNADDTGDYYWLNHIQIKVYYTDSQNPITGGSVAYVSDGRKAGEGVGAGTGVLVFYDENDTWIACDTGTAVAA